MQEKLLKNVKNLTKKTLDISTKNIDNVKNYTEEKVISKKKSTENTKLFVSNTTNKLVDEIKFNISEEQMMLHYILNLLMVYQK